MASLYVEMGGSVVKFVYGELNAILSDTLMRVFT